MHEIEAILHLWQASHNESKRAALATVVEVKGSAYRRAGARMLLVEDGRSAGMINGGCLDGDLWAHAHEVIQSGRAGLIRYDTTSSQDIVFGLGLGCRGVVKILVEPAHDLTWLAAGSKVAVVYEGEALGTRLLESSATREGAFLQCIEAPQRLLIFGAGADVVPLHAMAQHAGFNVEVFDHRAPFPNRRPLVPSTYHPIEKLDGHVRIEPDTACVIMTHNFLFDLELLKVLLPSPARYVGILGPRRRADELLEKIGHQTVLPPVDIAALDLGKLHAPIGLDIGGETPEEIALSILAEVQKTRRHKSGSSLRERPEIH